MRERNERTKEQNERAKTRAANRPRSGLTMALQWARNGLATGNTRG